MASTDAIIRLWNLCVASDASDHSDGGEQVNEGCPISVDVLRGVLQTEISKRLDDLRCASVDDILRKYFGTQEGYVGFLEYWKGMEAILEDCGVQQPHYEEHFIRDCILEHTPSPEGEYEVKDIRFFLEQATQLPNRRAPEHWKKFVEELPNDDVLVTSEEVGTAMLVWLQSLEKELRGEGAMADDGDHRSLPRSQAPDPWPGDSPSGEGSSSWVDLGPQGQPRRSWTREQATAGQIGSLLPSQQRRPPPSQEMRCIVAGLALLRVQVHSRLSTGLTRWAGYAISTVNGMAPTPVWNDPDVLAPMPPEEDFFDFHILEELYKGQAKTAAILEQRMTRSLQLHRFTCILLGFLEKGLRGIWGKWRRHTWETTVQLRSPQSASISQTGSTPRSNPLNNRAGTASASAGGYTAARGVSPRQSLQQPVGQRQLGPSQDRDRTPPPAQNSPHGRSSPHVRGRPASASSPLNWQQQLPQQMSGQQSQPLRHRSQTNPEVIASPSQQQAHTQSQSQSQTHSKYQAVKQLFSKTLADSEKDPEDDEDPHDQDVQDQSAAGPRSSTGASANKRASLRFRDKVASRLTGADPNQK